MFGRKWRSGKSQITGAGTKEEQMFASNSRIEKANETPTQESMGRSCKKYSGEIYPTIHLPDIVTYTTFKFRPIKAFHDCSLIGGKKNVPKYLSDNIYSIMFSIRTLPRLGNCLRLQYADLTSDVDYLVDNVGLELRVTLEAQHYGDKSSYSSVLCFV